MSQTLLSTPIGARRSAAATLAVRPPVPRIRIMGVDFAALDEEQVVAAFVDGAVEGVGRWVVTANLDHLRRFASEPETRELIGQADIVVADGTPIVFASPARA
jgi:N-acetylglucosaminyldiphosphoundecaprenol N-acetyl-beta-D-mannosaminyltransferase